jgi:AhpD family alkylhydroperoxidase
METRMKVNVVEPDVYKAMAAAESQLKTFDIDPKLRELIKVRASQINGCGYCINVHTKEARKLGETEQRLYALECLVGNPLLL